MSDPPSDSAASGGDVARAWFDGYIAAFNRSDFAALGPYYAADIDFQGRAAQVVGRDAVLGFYRDVKSRMEETIEVLDFIAEPGRIAAVLRTDLVAREACAGLPSGPLAAGERRSSVNFVFYDIAGGTFTRIRSAPFAPTTAAP